MHQISGTATAPVGSQPYREPWTRQHVKPPVESFSADEIRRALTRPHHLIDLLLGDRHRLTATIAEGNSLAALAGLMVAASLVFAIPYGLVLGFDFVWRVPVLFPASVLICFPSLHILGAYLGRQLTLLQNLTLSLIVASVAAIFAFGFFPVLWFLWATMPGDDVVVTPMALSNGLLGVSFLAGLGRLGSCVLAHPDLRGCWAHRSLVVVWMMLLTFITYRMANTLGVLG